MSFRIEEKVIIENGNFGMVSRFLMKSNAKVLHPKRRIKSLYFDNRRLQSFHDSEEGCLPRKKIRIRTYPGSNMKSFFEVKISSIEGRFKTSKEVHNDFLSSHPFGIVDSLYGLLDPTLYVEYVRHYYSLGELRITVDENIKYSSYSSPNIFVFDSMSVLEVKANINTKSEVINKEVPFIRKRFSKYCNGRRLLSLD